MLKIWLIITILYFSILKSSLILVSKNKFILQWLAILVVVLCGSLWRQLLRKRVADWVGQRRSVSIIVRWSKRWRLNEGDVEIALQKIERYIALRPATREELGRVVSSAPVLAALDEQKRAETLERFRDEIFAASVVWLKQHEESGVPFGFDVDSFHFLNPVIEDRSVGPIRLLIQGDIFNRFPSKQFDTLIYVLRGRGNHRLGQFFDNLRATLGFQEVIGLPLAQIERMNDRVLEDLLGACKGKSVLLIEPFLIDRGLDFAYDKIIEWGGCVNGVVVLFEVDGILPGTLLSHCEELASKTGRGELRGQILLNLREIP